MYYGAAMQRHRFFAIILLVTVILAGCGSLGPASPFGATVGGAQDIGYARQIIRAGGIPDSSAIVAEGLFSEHDIPSLSAECGGKLCIGLGYGYAPAVDDGGEALFVQLGLSSSIARDGFWRPRLQLALVIDRSGSMEGGRIEAVREALRRLLDKLSPEDEVTLVQFNNTAETLYGPSMLGDKRALLGAVNRLKADGGTDIEAGLRRGYSAIAELPKRAGYERRVILFTDAQPNIGATDAESFLGITGRYADEGIGLTAFGVGVDFGQDLIYKITQLRGGNFVFLENNEKITSVFDKEFDLLVTPIVHDMKLRVTPAPGLRLRDVYGLPVWERYGDAMEMRVPTVFLSNNRGAIVLRLERSEGGSLTLQPDELLASGEIDYTDIDGTHVARSVELRNGAAAALAPGGRHYSHGGVRGAVALTNIYLALHNACALHARGARAEALAVLERGRAEALLDDAVLNDAGFREEIALLEKLAENMSK